jgi:hypothetical protein
LGYDFVFDNAVSFVLAIMAFEQLLQALIEHLYFLFCFRQLWPFMIFKLMMTDVSRDLYSLKFMLKLILLFRIRLSLALLLLLMVL